MMYLENLDRNAVATLNIPTAQPILYRMLPITVPEPIGYVNGSSSSNGVDQVRQYMAINEKTYI